MLSSHRHRVVTKAGRRHSRPSSPKQAKRAAAAAAASSSSPDLHADVVVAGAGAAGLTAAHFAARSGGSSVVVLERTSAAGRKILMSGGERANVLPVHCKGAPSDIRTESARSDRLANRMLRFWPLESTKHWLEHEIALPLQCERSTNKYFPASNSARELRDNLLASCLSLGVRFEYHSGVTSIRRSSGCWEALLEDGRTARSRSLVLATGGASVPKCGTDGVGYSIIEHDLGVNLVQPYRALVPLRGVHPGGAQLPGVTLSAQTSAHDSRSPNSKKARSERTGFLFSHAGFSGPAVLDLSHLLVSGRSTHLSANFAGEPFDSVNEKLRTGGGRKLVKTLVAQWVPQRLSSALLAEQGIDAESTQAAQLTRKQRIALANALTAYDLDVTEPMGWSKAEVTAGGVRLTDVDVNTMELADAPNLHVIGELLETTGRIGGFNFYLSWVQGKLAGRSAARVHWPHDRRDRRTPEACGAQAMRRLVCCASAKAAEDEDEHNESDYTTASASAASSEGTAVVHATPHDELSERQQSNASGHSNGDAAVDDVDAWESEDESDPIEVTNGDAESFNAISKALKLLRSLGNVNLLRVQFPVRHMKPCSFLESMAPRNAVFCRVASRMLSSNGPLNTFLTFVGARVAALQPGGPAILPKPINPVQSECVRQRFLSHSMHSEQLLEQVSHQPPVTATWSRVGSGSERTLEYSSTLQAKPLASGPGVRVSLSGSHHLDVEGEQQYHASYPDLHMQFVPVPKTAYVGAFALWSDDGYQAVLHFKGHSNSILRRDSGVWGPEGTKLGELAGSCAYAVYTDLRSNAETVLYDAAKEPESELSLTRVPSGGSLDSEEVWADVKRHLHRKEFSRASAAKRAVEQKEREIRRSGRGSRRQPVFFEKRGSCWVPKGSSLWPCESQS